jgi:hypothetical protein
LREFVNILDAVKGSGIEFISGIADKPVQGHAYYIGHLGRHIDGGLHAFGEEGTPAFNALLQVSFIALFNFATFLLLIQIIGRLEIFDFLSKQKIYLFLIIFLFLGLNYLLLMRNNRSKSIIQEFDTMPSKSKRKIGIYLTCYLSAVVFLFTIALIFIGQ